jgi:hypothetical protein
MMKKMEVAKRILFWVLVVFVGMVVLGALVSLFRGGEARNVLMKGETVHFLGGGEQGILVLENENTLVSAPLEEVAGVRILESVPRVENPQTRVVLAKVPDEEGVVLGLIEEGAFRPLLSDGSQKYALSVTQDGRAVYGVGQYAPAFTLPGPVSEVSDGIEEVGTATEMSEEFRTDVEESSNENVIMSYDLSSGVEKNLGVGTVPRLIGGGVLVALAPEGVVRINTLDGTRATLLAHRGIDIVGSALSLDGMTAVLKSSTDTLVDVFTFSASEPKRLGIIAPGTNIQGVAFIDASHVILRFSTERAALYEVPGEEVPAGRIIGSLITIR